MAYEIYYAIGGVLLLGIVTWLIIRWLKKRKEILRLRNQVEQDLIDKLNYVSEEFERRNIENNGSSNPYEILWEVARRNPIGRTSKPSNATEQIIDGRELHPITIRRQDIQTKPSTRNKESIGQPRISKEHSGRNFFSKFKRS
jgi:hypothetical protein